MSSDFLTVSWDSFRKMVEHYAQTKVNTGDRIFDTLVHNFLLTIIVMIFAMFTPKEIGFLTKMKLGLTKNGVITEEICEPYNTYVKNRLISFNQAILSSENKEFNEVFATYVSPMIKNRQTVKYENGRVKPVEDKVEKNDKDKSDKSKFEHLCGMLSSTFRVIYAVNSDMIALATENNQVCVAYNSQEMFDEFIANIPYNKMQHAEVKDAKSVAVQKLFRVPDGEPINIMYQTQKKGTVYPDRNFSKFVTRHKETLLSYLRNFEVANTTGSLFGGFGTYNLGIIIYGKPGTGKTHFMKSMANYFRRPIEIIDMRLIKTRKQFETQFTNHKNVIYVLDEFDCLSGILQNRDGGDLKEMSQSAKIEELRKRYLEVLKMNAEKTPAVQQELDSIKSQISDAENVLTIDSVLTVLDGVDEMRGRIIIAATNYIDRIDPAILREGRFDVKLEFTEFNEDETRELLGLMFEENAGLEEMKRLQNCRLISGKYTPASLINLATKQRSLSKMIDILEVKE